MSLLATTEEKSTSGIDLLMIGFHAACPPLNALTIFKSSGLMFTLKQRYREPLDATTRARVHEAWLVPEHSEKVAMQLASGAGGGLVNILEKHFYRHAPLRWFFDETV